MVVIGQSGSGKTTLIRHMKTVLTPTGKTTGNITIAGKNISEIDSRTQAAAIGYVMQNPDTQIVTDKVWHELAFGLESLGIDNTTMRLRIGEAASYFGIQNLIHKDISKLSGGQKQLVNLASIMVMNPDILVLDEPTSQLDPTGAERFLYTIHKINRELGITIIITEHRLEQVFSMTNQVIVMDEGSVIADDSPAKVAGYLHQQRHPMYFAMPAPMQIYGGVIDKGQYPLTIGQLCKGIEATIDRHKKKVDDEVNIIKTNITTSIVENKAVAVLVKDVWFKYSKKGVDILKGINLTVYKGESLAIVGGNGSGKTTLLKCILNIEKPYSGHIYILGKSNKRDTYRQIVMVPQAVTNMFVKDTVKEELKDMYELLEMSDKEEKYNTIVEDFKLKNFLDIHPYDLSGGEQQRLAIAKAMMLESDVLVLDEPTKGMDTSFKQEFARIIALLKKQGKTIIMVSHDIEFCGAYMDRCCMCFDGDIVAVDDSHTFFANNDFYTTSANKVARNVWKDSKAIVTNEEVISEWKRQIKE